MQKDLLLRGVLVGSLLGMGLGLGDARVCRADDVVNAAKERFLAGQRDFSSGRYWQAARAFQEAYDLSKRADLLFNAAQAYERGEYWVRAVETYQTYIKAANNPPDTPDVELKIKLLQAKFTRVKLITDESAFVFVDGHEYGKTPLPDGLDVDSGYHRIEVRKGKRAWVTESQLSAGQTVSFPVQLVESDDAPSRGLTTAEDLGEGGRPKLKTKRVAIGLGIGGAVDVLSNSFPPHQAQITIAAEYRVIEGTLGAFDIGVKLPIDAGQSWVNAGFLLTARGAYTPKPKLPLELYLALDAGFIVMDYRSSAAAATRPLCEPSPGSKLPSCTVYAARLNPHLGVAYRVIPALELRAQVFGVDVNVSSPVFDPRLNFGLFAAYRFN